MIAAVMLLGAVQIAATLRDHIRDDIARGGSPIEPVPAPEADPTPGADLLA